MIVEAEVDPPPESMTSLYRVGNRIATNRLSQFPRAALGAAWLLGPAAWRTIARSRRGAARTAEIDWAKQAATVLGMRLRITGLENIDRSERYVVAPLHEGFADAIALLHLPLRMRFVVRDELLNWRVLGEALRAGGHIAVEPERFLSAAREFRSGAREVLATESLVVFPQGTILGIESAFTSGAFHLAKSLGLPLLPVVVTGTHRIWEHPFSPLVRFGQPAHIQVLPPVSPEQAVVGKRDIERRMKRIALEATPQPRRYDPDRDGWWDGYRFEIDADFPELAARVDRHRRSVAEHGIPGPAQ